MAQYRKKPVVIDAWQWDGGLIGFGPDWLFEAINSDKIRFSGEVGRTHTDGHGWVEFSKGDWIIKGVKDEIYPCQPDVFAATYEPVPE